MTTPGKQGPTLYGRDLFGNPVEPPWRGQLASDFLVPPFSVLNAREGWWQERKRAWAALGIAGEAGRGDAPGGDGDRPLRQHATALGSHIGAWLQRQGEDLRGTKSGTSVFDPVLCELAYRWFCPLGGHILDPFAGEATKGIVAGHLGYEYTGIELRAEQVAANEAQARAAGLRPQWVCGDSARLGELLPAGAYYDMVFTSPPYYDLELYDGGAADGSAKTSYDEFMAWYERIFAQVVERLLPARFLVVKVGEIRNKATGAYRNFVGDNANLFIRLGLAYYNEAILVTAVGSLPIRAGGQFAASRKLGKTHQNLLVFYSGDPRRIKDEFIPLQKAAVPGTEAGTG